MEVLPWGTDETSADSLGLRHRRNGPGGQSETPAVPRVSWNATAPLRSLRRHVVAGQRRGGQLGKAAAGVLRRPRRVDYQIESRGVRPVGDLQDRYERVGVHGTARAERHDQLGAGRHQAAGDLVDVAGRAPPSGEARRRWPGARRSGRWAAAVPRRCRRRPGLPAWGRRRERRPIRRQRPPRPRSSPAARPSTDASAGSPAATIPTVGGPPARAGRRPAPPAIAAAKWSATRSVTAAMPPSSWMLAQPNRSADCPASRNSARK